MSTSAEVNVGTVAWFNNSKGYGFIKFDDASPAATPPDIFVHYSSIQGKGFKSLKEGDRVEFVSITGSKGLQADNVRVIDDASNGN